MKKAILVSLAMFTGVILYSQEKKMNQTIFDPKSNHDISIGYCNLTDITDTVFNSSYSKEYDEYNPDPVIIEQIKSLLNEIRITIVLGTWCSDSREQVPRFRKILDLSGKKELVSLMICTDRDKKAGDVSLEGMDISKVPTFIIYFDDIELGRIIETPQTTMENDLLLILKKQL